jgi:hypothetical protein
MANSDGEGLSEEVKEAVRAANKAFVDAIDPLLQKQFEFDSFPDKLYHYTDFGGLKGILKSGSLWATYSRTMNDASEQQYGEKVVRDYLGRLPDGGELGKTMGLLQQRNFAACFCDSSQVLSMWVTYTGRGGGYCLQFDGLLKSSFSPFVKLPFRITYGDAPPENVRSILEKACQYSLLGRDEAGYRPVGQDSWR